MKNEKLNTLIKELAKGDCPIDYKLKNKYGSPCPVEWFCDKCIVCWCEALDVEIEAPESGRSRCGVTNLECSECQPVCGSRK